jgi:hypothetical protein
MLVAETKRESQTMAMLGSFAWLCWTWQVGAGTEERFAPVLAGYWILGLLFVPALIMILRRPNTSVRQVVSSLQANERLYDSPASSAKI